MRFAPGLNKIAQADPQFDLTTPHGKLIASLMASLAEFERDLLRERIRSGIALAKARGRAFGRSQGERPKSDRKATQVIRLHQEGKSYRGIAKEVDLSVTTVMESALVMALARAHRVDITAAAATDLVLTFAATFVGRGISEVVSGWIPGFGNAVNALTAGGLFVAVGLTADAHLPPSAGRWHDRGHDLSPFLEPGLDPGAGASLRVGASSRIRAAHTPPSLPSLAGEL